MQTKKTKPKDFRELLASSDHPYSVVAAACSVSEMTVRNWHSGKQTPNVKDLRGLANLFGLDYSTLVELILAC